MNESVWYTKNPLVKAAYKLQKKMRRGFRDKMESIYYHYNVSKSYKQLQNQLGKIDGNYDKYLRDQLEETLLKRKLFGRLKFEVIPLIDMLASKYNFKGQSILCVGCRDDDEIRYFKKSGAAKVTGIDLYHAGKDILIMDMHDLKFKDSTFNVVYSRHSFEHAYDKRKAAMEFVRVLKNGGVVVIEVPGKYKGGGDYNYFNDMNDVLDAFGSHIDQFLWKEYSPKEENTDKMDIIRVMFTIKKETATQFIAKPENKDQREYFEQVVKTSKIRALNLAQIFPGIEKQPVEIGAIDPDTNHPNHVDMLYVCAIARQVKAKKIFEFGTYLGRTTYHLALSPYAEKVYTLDLDPKTAYPDDLKLGRAVTTIHQRDLQGCFFRNQDAASRITQLHGDCRTFDYSPYYQTMDFIFIDGGHEFEFVENDTKQAFKMLKPGGIVLWHDFAPKSQDVVRFAQQFSAAKSLFWIQNTSLLVYIDGVDAMTYQAETPPYARSVIKPNV